MKLNAQKKSEFGGKVRTFILNMNTMATIEDNLGVNLMQEGEQFFENLSFSKMRVLVWALLYKEDPAPTLDEVGEWLSDVGIEETSVIISDLFTNHANRYNPF